MNLHNLHHTHTPHHGFSTSQKKYGFLLLLAVIGIKVCLIVWAATLFDFTTYQSDTWLTIWDRWDAKAYETIATSWYTPQDVALDYRQFLSHFPPVYPILIIIASHIFFLPIHMAAFVVSWIAILAATYYLYKLVLIRTNNVKIALFSGLLLNLYPTSYFTLAPYTESVFLFFIIFSFYWLEKHPNKSYVTGLFGALAILTRLLGIAILPAYCWVLWKKYKSHTLDISDAFLIVLPIVALECYLLINQHYFGSTFFFLHEYATNPFSAKTTGLPFQETFRTLGTLVQHTIHGIWDQSFMDTLGWNSIFTAIALFILLFGFMTKLPGEYMVYALTYITLFASFQWGVSNARYSFGLFPIFIILASIKNRFLLWSICILFAGFLLYFTRVYTSGSWAF